MHYHSLILIIETKNAAVAEEAAQKGGGYSNHQEIFVWRQITFLWKDSKEGLQLPGPPLCRL